MPLSVPSSTRRRPGLWRRFLLPIGALALALAACAGPESRSMADSGVDAMAVDTVYLDEVMRLGADTSEALGSVRAIAMNAAGMLWVLDGPTREIRMFGENGALVRRVGRPGAGPGEFAQPAALVARPTGHMWIDDPGNARIVVMDTAGRVVGNHVVARGCMQARPWPAAVDAAHRYVSVGGANCDLVVRWDSTFRELDRAAAPRDSRPPRDIQTPWGSASIPFAGEVLWHPAADTTIWALRTDDYRITRLTFRGDTVRSAEVPFERARLSEADRALADEFLAELARDGVVVDRSVLPRDKPAAVSFFVASDGHLWVERYTEPDELGRRWDIVDSATLRVRAVVMSAVPIGRFPVPVVRGDRVVAATEDSLGTPLVVVLRRR